MKRDSIIHTFLVTIGLAVVCSLLVSSAAVGLRGLQERNKALYKKRNILKAAGLYQRRMDVEAEFAKVVEIRLIDIATGTFVDPNGMDFSEFDQRSAARDPQSSEALAPERDQAGIVRRENRSLVYMIKKDGKVDQVVLPFYGKGLFSTLFGFLALDADRRTVRGVTFYEHGETPGLGGEVDSEKWTASWAGKNLYDDGGGVALSLHKGSVTAGDPRSEYGIDGLSGATMTSKGVTDMIQFWFGPDGFQPFLNNADF